MLRWALATGGLAGAAVSHFWLHLNCVPGLVLTIIVLAALQSEPSALTHGEELKGGDNHE